MWVGVVLNQLGIIQILCHTFLAISRPPLPPLSSIIIFRETPPPPYKLSYRHIWIVVPQMLNKLVMIRLYINLHSYENQPNDELHQNLKDFDTIGDCFERFFSSSTYLLSINTSYLSLFPNPPENCHQLSYFGKPPPPLH